MILSKTVTGGEWRCSKEACVKSEENLGVMVLFNFLLFLELMRWLQLTKLTRQARPASRNRQQVERPATSKHLKVTRGQLFFLLFSRHDKVQTLRGTPKDWIFELLVMISGYRGGGIAMDRAIYTYGCRATQVLPRAGKVKLRSQQHALHLHNLLIG